MTSILQIEWFNELHTQSFYRMKQCNFFLLVFFADSSKDKRYKVARKGVYSPYVLTITNVSHEDTGNYYCCLSSGCSADVEKCQNFTLAVTGNFYSENDGRNCFTLISCTQIFLGAFSLDIKIS